MNWEASAPHLWAYLPLNRQELLAAVAAMCAALGMKTGMPEIVITDDAGSEECNRAHLGCPGPTNVLSFPLTAQNAASGVMGSLVLSVPVLRREALLYGQEPAGHCIRLLAHGLAHLAGFKHGPEMWELCGRLEEAGRRAAFGLNA